jgi:hypothetical protein
VDDVMKATKNEEAAMFECYRRMYKASTPSADFDKLVEEAEVNEQGQKVIDFMSYEISESEYMQILDDVIKEFKVKPKYKAQAFKVSIHLGCSPKFKRDETVSL